MKRRLIDLMILIGIFLVVSVLVIVSGIVPVKASGGHLPGLAWLLEFASGRSIATHSVGIVVPRLDTPELIQLGAVAYQSNCQWCHGSPREPKPIVPSRMFPAPPYLPDVLEQWKPEELFTIVNHGINFAGMPAWPTQDREEEVWAVVAFLTEFQRMNGNEYHRLLSRDKDSDDDTQSELIVGKNCVSCHGYPGEESIAPLVPKLDRLSAEYLRNAIHAYATGVRPSGFMEPIAARLSDADIEQIVEEYAADTPRHEIEVPMTNGRGVELAKQLIFHGDSHAKIPACIKCHDSDSESRHQDYPDLSGQPAEYLERQLELFAKEVRNGPQASIMYKIATKLSDEQRQAVAKFYQSNDQ